MYSMGGSGYLQGTLTAQVLLFIWPDVSVDLGVKSSSLETVAKEITSLKHTRTTGNILQLNSPKDLIHLSAVELNSSLLKFMHAQDLFQSLYGWIIKCILY